MQGGRRFWCMRRNVARSVLVATLVLFAGACGSDGNDAAVSVERRSIDGSGNNVEHPKWGRAGAPLMRIAPVAYMDGVAEPSGADRPNPRAISNACCWQEGEAPNRRGATDYLWQWGQFIDHDIALSGAGDADEDFDIPVPMADPMFDPMATGTMMIPMDRSNTDPSSGTAVDNPRNQINEITAYVDASQVYGSDAARAAALRANDGSGRLAISAGNLLPFNVDGLANAEAEARPEAPDPTFFLAGDVRANEQVGLTAMHTLFVREHNRLADLIRAAEPGLGGEEIYQRARAKVGAIMQSITYNEFLPMLLGAAAIGPYGGYVDTVDASIDATFSTAAYRLGHTLLSPTLLRLDASGATIAEGDLSLRDAFFQPHRLSDEGGIDPLLRGLAAGAAQEVDVQVVDDVRNFLFGRPGSGGLDLASLNIQRGRDHGLMSYNETRVAFGLPAVQSFAEISSDPDTAARLESAYGSVDLIDPWIGGLAEDHLHDAMVGELIYTVVTDQFRRLRDGDRFWYQRVFSGDELAEIETTRLSDVIRRNTPIGDEIQDDVFALVGE